MIDGVRRIGIGACLAPFIGGTSLVLGACHLVSGVADDQLRLDERLLPTNLIEFNDHPSPRLRLLIADAYQT